MKKTINVIILAGTFFCLEAIKADRTDCSDLPIGTDVTADMPNIERQSYRNTVFGQRHINIEIGDKVIVPIYNELEGNLIEEETRYIIGEITFKNHWNLYQINISHIQEIDEIIERRLAVISIPLGLTETRLTEMEIATLSMERRRRETRTRRDSDLRPPRRRRVHLRQHRQPMPLPLSDTFILNPENERLYLIDDIPHNEEH